MSTNLSERIECKRANGSVLYLKNPKHITQWIDDIRCWPPVDTTHIVVYLMLKKACDGAAAMNWKSLESYEYCKAGFVGKIQHFLEGQLVYLKGAVRASQSCNEFRHAWVCIELINSASTSTSIEILTGYCTCMARNAKACSHIGAVLFQISFANSAKMVGKSCTDVVCSWTNANLPKNILPEASENIDFSNENMFLVQHDCTKRKKKFVGFVDTHPKYSSYATMVTAVRNSNIFDVATSVPSTMSLILEDSGHDFENENEEVELGSAVYHSHNDIENLDKPGCLDCNLFYDMYINIGESNIAKLFNVTKEQSKSVLWRSSRLLRITASGANNVPKRATTCPENFLKRQFFSTFFGTKATKHGNDYESTARDLFSSNFDYTIDLCGTCVSSVNPWLSGSPDGILHSSENDTLQILEIKCPVTDLIDLDSLNIKQRETENGIEYFLRPNGPRNYYLQMQLNMYCMELDKSILYAWTKHEQILVNVPFDSVYVEETITRLKTFYFQYFLPRCADLEKRNMLKISEEYKDLCLTI